MLFHFQETNVMDTICVTKVRLRDILILLAVFVSATTAHEKLAALPAHRDSVSLNLRESLAKHYWPEKLTSSYKRDLMASVCVGQSLLTRYSTEDWSRQMWDSSGISVAGRLAGGHQARGHQQLCTDVSQEFGVSLYQQLELLEQMPQNIHKLVDNFHPLALNISTPTINGRYCIVSMRSRVDAYLYSTGSSELLATVSNHKTPSYATCVPDTCSENFLQSWLQRVEGKEMVVNVKCTTRSTVLAADHDPKHLLYATQPPTPTTGVYHYLINNTNNSLFKSVDTKIVTSGTLIFCTFAGLLLLITAVATLLDCFHGNAPVFTLQETEQSNNDSSRDSDDQNRDSRTHSQQHHLLQTSEATSSVKNTIYVKTTPPVYGWGFLQCFSVPQNWQRLFPQHQSSNAIPVIDGLRVVGMCWIIVVHRYMFMLISSTHPHDLLKERDNPNYWWLFNAYPAVDIFFVISGFLLSVTPLPRLNLKNIINVCVLRYLRLAPVVIATVWGICTAFAHLGSGPVWEAFYDGLLGGPCAKTWWSSILLMPNVYHANDMCLGHLWSMSIDWQLSIVSIIMLAVTSYCINNNNTISNTSIWRRNWPLVLLTVLSIIVPWVVSVVYSLPPLPSVANLQRSLDFYNQYYVSTICRASPYCVGLLAGQLHQHLKQQPLLLNRRIIRLGHAAGTAAVSAVFVSPLFINSDNLTACALHNALAKPIFAAAIAFLIITSCYDQGGLFGWILSRPLVGRMSRCSYSIYLISLPMQIWAAATQGTTPTDPLLQAYLCGGDLLLCTSSGVALALLVELPFARLLGNAMKRGKKQSSRESKSTNSEAIDKLGDRIHEQPKDSPQSTVDNNTETIPTKTD